MNYYETLYIVHPALEAGRLKDIILSVETIFTNNVSSIVSTQVWGKKKLAYYIDKQKYGTYVLIQFESDGKNINTISTELEINPNILAHLTTRISESDLQKESKSLDDQITGDKPNDSSEEKTVEQKEEKTVEAEENKDNVEVKSEPDDNNTPDIQEQDKENENSEKDSSDKKSSKQESEE